MLKANHLFNGIDGSVLCQNPETFAYALYRPLRLAGLDVESFAGHVDQVVDQARKWMRFLGGPTDVEG